MSGIADFTNVDYIDSFEVNSSVFKPMNTLIGLNTCLRFSKSTLFNSFSLFSICSNGIKHSLSLLLEVKS